jgi:hypothetical protein
MDVALVDQDIATHIDEIIAANSALRLCGLDLQKEIRMAILGTFMLFNTMMWLVLLLTDRCRSIRFARLIWKSLNTTRVPAS